MATTVRGGLVSRTPIVGVSLVVFANSTDVVVYVDGRECYRIDAIPAPLSLPDALQLVAADQRMTNKFNASSIFDADGIAAHVAKRMGV